MIRLITTIVLLVVLCVLVVLNLDYATPVSVFWVIFDRVPVVAVGMVSFVTGVLYSFFLYASRYIAARRKNSLKNRRKDVQRREKEIAVGDDVRSAENAAAPTFGGAAGKRGRRSRR